MAGASPGRTKREKSLTAELMNIPLMCSPLVDIPIPPPPEFPKAESSSAMGSSGYHGVRTTSSDWSEAALNGTHYWYEYEGSAMCNLTTPDKDCPSVGYRRTKVRCSACRMVLHDECQENFTVKCRSTFRDVNFKKESWTHHHWVLQRKTHTPKCRECNKSLPKGPTWGGGKNSKAFIAVTCSWCKDSYHPTCFKLSLIEDHCSLGDQEQIIVPPHWIVFGSKARSGGSRKGAGRRKISYSTRPSSSTKRPSRSKRLSEHEREEIKRPFHVKMPSSVPHSKHPLLVFVNPKSGGNQGAYLIQAFQWYLNPRQVFDITEGGPGLALSLYQNVVNLRILVCGGDGTVGWVLSEIDKLNFIHQPPVAILPLGTGNDLARVLNWGPGYAGEPIDKLLYHVQDGIIHSLDRWEIGVEELEEEGDSCNSKGEPEPSGTGTTLHDPDIPVKDLPINIMNNYFSIGLDAYIQYQFHTGREAKPEKFNSRAYNKFVYFKGGIIDTFEQKYKDVSKFIELICDGKDYTEKIREKKIHVILFLNIKSYGAGTNPWGNHSSSTRVQAMDDGYMEVVGLFGAAQMAALQVGDTGFRIAQCKKATIITRKAVHCQVDGEPLYLASSILRISRKTQSLMIMKTKSTRHLQSSDINHSEMGRADDDSDCDWRHKTGDSPPPDDRQPHSIDSEPLLGTSTETKSAGRREARRQSAPDPHEIERVVGKMSSIVEGGAVKTLSEPLEEHLSDSVVEKVLISYIDDVRINTNDTDSGASENLMVGSETGGNSADENIREIDITFPKKAVGADESIDSEDSIDSSGSHQKETNSTDFASLEKAATTSLSPQTSSEDFAENKPI